MYSCQFCLSSERRTSFVNCLDILKIIEIENEDVRACWECRAILRRFLQFRRQAERARELLHHSNSDCLSSLQQTTKLGFDREFASLDCDWSTEIDSADANTLPLLLDVDKIDETEIFIPKPEPVESCDSWEDNSAETFEVPVVPVLATPIQPPVLHKKRKRHKRKAKTRETYALSDDDNEADFSIDALPDDVSPKEECNKEKKGEERYEEIAPEQENNLEAVQNLDVEEMTQLAELQLDEDLVGACTRYWETREEVVKFRLARLRSTKFVGARHPCTSCAISFRGARWLADHVRQLHVESPHGLACPVCDCRAADASALSAHAATHAVYKCGRCKFRTRLADSMRRHARAHRLASARSYTCDICGKQLRTKQSFSIHRRSHVSKLRYECDYCGRVYATREQICRHIKNHRKPFLCDVCGKAFPSKSVLRCHSMAHVGAEEREFECSLCHKRYINKFKLEVHARFHTGEKPYTCEPCERGYREKAQLSAHLRKHHPEMAEPIVKRKKIQERTRSVFVNKPFVEPQDKPPVEAKEPAEKKRRGRQPRSGKEYECNVCGRKMKDRWRLKFHLAAHSNERAYKCEECDLTFKYPQGVWTHKLLHQGGKQHQCNVCGAQFTQKGNLTSHMKIHNNERPFECTICGHKFRVRRDLRKHTFLRHADAQCSAAEPVF